ncbi:MAG: sensor histidine kinase [Halorientalis sp.]
MTPSSSPDADRGAGDNCCRTVVRDHGYTEIRLTASEPATVDTRIGPALRELVENAVTHSDAEPPQVTVQVTATETTATVEITDNGPGIPKQERQALETGSESPLEHGSGLGLWLAYWLIHYVGGDIEIRTPDIGTTVSVQVPRQRT